MLQVDFDGWFKIPYSARLAYAAFIRAAFGPNTGTFEAMTNEELEQDIAKNLKRGNSMEFFIVVNFCTDTAYATEEFADRLRSRLEACFPGIDLSSAA
jgi:hypothetical protein